jgi:hypothetical protein
MKLRHPEGEETIDKYLRAFEDGTMPPDACGPRIGELREKIAGLESR